VSTINIIRYISIFKKISIEAKITRKVKWMVIYKVYVVFTDWAYYHSFQKKDALDSQPQVIKLTSCLPMVDGAFRVLWLLPPLKLVAMI
jgi:hypothetical protein